jgi:hypothetical protein
MSGSTTSQKSRGKNPDAWFRAKYPGAFARMPRAQVFDRNVRDKRRFSGFVSDYTIARCLGPEGSPDAPIRYCAENDTLYEYVPEEGIYVVRTGEQVMHILSMILDDCAAHLPSNRRTAVRGVASPRHLRPVITALEGIHNLKHPGWNRDLRYLHVGNGVVDLYRLRLLPFSPSLPSTWKLPVDWDPDAPEPHRFNRMLDRLFPRQEDRDLAVDVLASAFLGNPFQRLVVLGGAGGTGKTTLLTLIERLLGDGAYGHLRLGHADNRFTAAGWAGRLLLHEEETTQEKLDRGREALKALSGQDTLEIEMKYVQERRSFRPRALPVLTTNHRLGIPCSADFEAWKRRLVFFDVPKPEEEFERKPGFADELLEREGTGILRSFLTRAHQLLDETSLRPLTRAQERRVDAFLSSADPLAEWAETMVKPAPGEGVQRDDAIESAVRWLRRREYQDIPTSTHAWSRRLKGIMGRAGYRWSNSMSPKGWRGARLLG